MRLAYLALPLLLLGGAAWAADTWTIFGDPAGVFTLAVPATPAEGHDSVPGGDGKPIQMVSYVIEREKGALALLVSDFTRFADTSRTLEESVKNIRNGAPNGFSDAPITVDGNAGHDVHFLDKDGLRIEDRIFFVGKKLYQVMTVQAPDAGPESAATAQRFLSGVHFTKR